MHSRWSESEARAIVAHFARSGIGEDLALCVYSTRLLGRDPRLVLHGGGNTSVKTRVTDHLGDELEVLCVKGSGWDMAEIEPQGLPALKLAPLRRLRALSSLADEQMVNLARANLLDALAPNPSVETLLHAFLPHKYVDHTHANAILSLTNRRDGARRCADLFGTRTALVPYVMPGFALAKLCAETSERHPQVEGLVLLKHGIFTFGASASEAYERMIDLVSLAEADLARSIRRRPARTAAAKVAPVHEVAPILRGLLALPSTAADDEPRRVLLAIRSSPTILDYVNGGELARYARAGPATPDHVIRTKPWPLILPAPGAGDLTAFRDLARRAIADYVAEYRGYFERHSTRQGTAKIPLDPMPRVVLVPGLGLVAAAASAKDAAIAADIAETTIEVVSATEADAQFESIPESDIFDMEYWSLEQAKLGKAKEGRLARHVVVVTGGAAGIGAATARAFAAEGAEVMILDIDPAGAERVAKQVGGGAARCDVTDAESVRAAFRAVVERFGGLDVVVSNAGRAWQGRIGEVPEDVLRASFEINFYGHQRVAQAAVAIMRAQGTGGVLLFNVSKQAVNPGQAFGPYGLPKAATLALMRQYALDHGAEGIRANAVNADRVRSGLLDDAMIAARAKARGVTEAEYMQGNLLGREVTAKDVAQAFVALALARTTTAAVLTVDGGNIAAALR